MVRKILVPLFAWEVLVLGSFVAYVLVRYGRLDLEESQGIIATAILGLLVVLLCWPICRTMVRASGAVVGFVVGFATPIIGGWIWSRLATQNSFALPHQFIYLGLLWSIPSGIGGAVVGFLQAGRPIPQSADPSLRN